MNERDFTKDLMIIQDKKVAFAEMVEYNEEGEKVIANIKLTAGQLCRGEQYMIILQPFDYFQHSIGTHLS